MTPIYQTSFGPDKGNCMQASVASILDLKLEDVPNFIEFEGDEWFWGKVKFIGNRGYKYLGYCSDIYTDCFSMDDLKNFKGINGYFLTSGKSPRHDCLHMTVYKQDEDGNFALAHDPHKDGTGILNITDVMIFEKQ